MHAPTLLAQSDTGLLLLLRIDTVDSVSKLALLATRRTPGASLCARGENSVLRAALAVSCCFLVGLGFVMPATGLARGTIKTW